LSRLKNNCYVIISGTNDGNLEALTNYDRFVATHIPLTPLSIKDIDDYGKHYVALHDGFHWPTTLESFLKNFPLLGLIYQTSQVPRLVIFALESLCATSSIVAAYSLFESKTLFWYKDAFQSFEDFSLDELFFVCAVGYPLSYKDTIPGTQLVVSDLVYGGMMFHYRDNRYTSLLELFSKKRISTLFDYAKSLVQHVDLSKFYFSFDVWLDTSLSLDSIGIQCDSILTQCLCIKYYLHSLVKRSPGPFPFTDVIDLHRTFLLHQNGTLILEMVFL
jgi:hypothetical protein